MPQPPFNEQSAAGSGHGIGAVTEMDDEEELKRVVLFEGPAPRPPLEPSEACCDSARPRGDAATAMEQAASGRRPSVRAEATRAGTGVRRRGAVGAASAQTDEAGAARPHRQRPWGVGAAVDRSRSWPQWPLTTKSLNFFSSKLYKIII